MGRLNNFEHNRRIGLGPKCVKKRTSHQIYKECMGVVRGHWIQRNTDLSWPCPGLWWLVASERWTSARPRTRPPPPPSQGSLRSPAPVCGPLSDASQTHPPGPGEYKLIVSIMILHIHKSFYYSVHSHCRTETFNVQNRKCIFP